MAVESTIRGGLNPREPTRDSCCEEPFSSHNSNSSFRYTVVILDISWFYNFAEFNLKIHFGFRIVNEL